MKISTVHKPPAVIADTFPVLVEHAAHPARSTRPSARRGGHHPVGPFEQLAGSQPVPDRHREAQLGAMQHMGGTIDSSARRSAYLVRWCG